MAFRSMLALVARFNSSDFHLYAVLEDLFILMLL